MKPWLCASRFLRSPNADDGVTTKREGGPACPEGGRGRGGGTYVKNFHFPSAAVCITQHGPVVMAIATGQMMRMWVHLVMNFSSADGCLTRVHFQFTTWKPEALRRYLKYTAADVQKVTDVTHVSVTFAYKSCCKALSLSSSSEIIRQLIRMYQDEANKMEAPGV